MCVAKCAAAIVLSSVIANASAEEAPIRSWSALEQEFARRDSWKDFSYEEFLEYPTYAEIAKKPNRMVFTEMITQDRYPLVVIAGYRGLERFYPDQTYLAAIILILESDRPMIGTIASAWDKLKTKPTSAEGREAMRILSNAGSRRVINLSIIVGSLDREFLEKWFDELGQAEKNPTLLAVVIDTLLCREAQANPMRVSRMKSVLRELAVIPGPPRQIYVLHGEQSDPEFQFFVTQVLSDPDTSEVDIGSIVLRRGKFIKEHVDLNNLSLPEKKRSLVARLIARYGSREPSTTPSAPTTAPAQE